MKQYSNPLSGIDALQLQLPLNLQSCKPLSTRSLQPTPVIPPPKYKKQQRKFKMPNFNISKIVYAGNTTMYANPHIIHDKESILINKKTNYNREQQEQQLMSYDPQFLVQCQNGRYCIEQKIQSLQKGIEEFSGKVGANLVCLKQINKTKTITDTFSTKVKVNANANNKDNITIRGDFQSANLSQYWQVDQKECLITLKNDTNTQGYTQWFQLFFQRNVNDKILNVSAAFDNSNIITTDNGKIYKFLITNIRKPIKFMPQMKLLTKVYEKQQNQTQWVRNLKFQLFQNTTQSKNNKKCYALAFCLEQKLLNNGIFVSLSNPYSFSRLGCLNKQMTQLGSEFQIIQIGKSTLGNSIICYRYISSNPSSRTILILARQHASQTSSSFICQSLIKQLTIYNTYDNLLYKFNWHIIPIANPDGIVHGNSRTTIRGYDMNRCWGPYVMHCSQQVMAINQYIMGLGLRDGDIMLDLHSHSREFGMFSYANQKTDFVQFFNKNMAQLCEYYEINKCKIGYDNQKRNTFRVQMQSRFKIRNILTLQTSFYGYIDKISNKLKQFYPVDYQKIAINILTTLDQFSRRQPKLQNLLARLEAIEKQEQQQQGKVKQRINKIVNNESQSDSDPQGDYLNQQDRNQIQKQMQLEPVRKQKILGNLQSKINIWPIPNRNIFSSRSNKKRKHSEKSQTNQNRLNTITDTNIVNLYKGAINVNNKLEIHSCNQSKSNRNLSLLNRQRFNCSFQLKHELLSNQDKEKQSLTVIKQRKSTKNFNNSSYEQRRSFKSLFACAQMRNSQNMKSQSKDKFSSSYYPPRSDEAKNVKIETNQLRLSFSQDSQSKRKLNKRVKTIVFPKQQKYQQQDVLRLKALHQIFQKKMPPRQLKKPQNVQKIKSQRSQNGRNQKLSNQKIAQLCQYVKKIQKGTIFT